MQCQSQAQVPVMVSIANFTCTGITCNMGLWACVWEIREHLPTDSGVISQLGYWAEQQYSFIAFCFLFPDGMQQRLSSWHLDFPTMVDWTFKPWARISVSSTSGSCQCVLTKQQEKNLTQLPSPHFCEILDKPNEFIESQFNQLENWWVEKKYHNYHISFHT